MSTLQYTLVGQEDGTSNLTVFVPGRDPLAAHSTHPNFEAILAGVLSQDDSVIDLFDIAAAAGTKFERLSERVTTSNGRLYLGGEEINDALTQQVVRFLQDGVEDWKPLVAFFENVQSNPNENSRNELYNWLAKESFTITETGMIVGYKGVDLSTEHGYESRTAGKATVNGEVFEGKIPNPIGAIVEMPRSDVDDDTRVDCSNGLHVGTYGYAHSFATVCLEVEVNPRDVVSVPQYDANKMRVCRYKVVGKLDGGRKFETPVKETKTARVKKAVKKAVTREVRVGDVYADTDKRRAGRTFKVETINAEGSATGKSLPQNVTRTIAVDRLQSRKYKLVKKGRKS